MSDMTMEQRIKAVARSKAGEYARFAEYEDIVQELWVYALGGGQRHLSKLIDKRDEFKVMRALHGAAKQYCEREKAAKSGYSFEDIAWYSPARLAELIPIALNDKWDGLTEDGDENAKYGKTDGGEGGTLLAMIADIRRVLPRNARVGDYTMETEEGMARLTRLADRLGGEFPEAPGYHRGRRAVRNATAIAMTEAA